MPPRPMVTRTNRTEVKPVRRREPKEHGERDVVSEAGESGACQVGGGEGEPPEQRRSRWKAEVRLRLPGAAVAEAWSFGHRPCTWHECRRVFLGMTGRALGVSGAIPRMGACSVRASP